MGLLGRVKTLVTDQRLSLTSVAIGTIGTLLTAVGLYATFHERKPDVVVDILNESNVLDIRTPRRDITINFMGQDLVQTNRNLRIVVLRVSNNGEADVLQAHYDLNEPWGVRVENGQAIEIRLLEASSAYLRRQVQPRLASNATIEFRKVILERGAHSSIEILVLHALLPIS